MPPGSCHSFHIGGRFTPSCLFLGATSRPDSCFSLRNWRRRPLPRQFLILLVTVILVVIIIRIVYLVANDRSRIIHVRVSFVSHLALWRRRSVALKEFLSSRHESC